MTFSRNCNITVNSSELILIKPCANLSRVERYFSFLHPNSTPRNPNIANTSFINATYQLNRRNQISDVPFTITELFHRRSRERRKYSVGSFSLRVRGGERSRERIRVLLVKGQPEASRVRHTSLPLSLPLSPRARLLL